MSPYLNFDNKGVRLDLPLSGSMPKNAPPISEIHVQLLCSCGFIANKYVVLVIEFCPEINQYQVVCRFETEVNIALQLRQTQDNKLEKSDNSGR